MSARKVPEDGGGPRLSVESAVHQLQMRLIELQMQNEALLAIRLDTESSRDHYQVLFRHAPVAFIVLTRNGVVEEINEAGLELLGHEASQVIGQDLTSMIHPAEQPTIHACLEASLISRERQSGEVHLRRPDGSPLQLYLQCNYVESGEITGRHIVSMTDTSHKQREQDAQRNLLSRVGKLTDRERQVLRLALEGFGNREVSERLGISMRTVETHRSRIYVKTGIESLFELARQASHAGVSIDQIAPERPAAK